MKPPRRNALRTVAATVLSTLAFGAAAQDAYPSRPIRIVVPYPAGGTTDQLARAIQKPMQEVPAPQRQGWRHRRSIQQAEAPTRVRFIVVPGQLPLPWRP